jgi:hypothetical protein
MEPKPPAVNVGWCAEADGTTCPRAKKAVDASKIQIRRLIDLFMALRFVQFS